MNRFTLHIARQFPIVLLATILLSTGCVSPAPRSTGGTAPQFSKEQLRESLEDFADYLEAKTKQAASDIDAAQPDRQTRINTLLWRSRVIPAASAALKQDDALEAFLDCWALCVRLTLYFEEGDGKSLFGKQQSVAVDAAREIQDRVERVGRLFLTQDRMENARGEVLSFARTHPITGRFSDIATHTATAARTTTPILESILKLPLAPFQMFEGIDRGAAAIYGFTAVAGRFADIVEEWPESFAWQLQLMLLQLEEYETVRSFLASLSKMADSSADLARTARTLPENIHKHASELIAEIDAKQANLQATLKQADQTAATVEQALQKANEAADSIDRSARSVAEAGIAWNEASKVIAQSVTDMSNLGGKDKPATQPAKPFNINDYRLTADSLSGAALQLRQLTTDLQGLIDSPQLQDRLTEMDARINQISEDATGGAKRVTDHATWRLAQLAVFAFCLAIIYRIISTRWIGKHAKS